MQGETFKFDKPLVKYKETGNVNERNDRRTGAPRKTMPRQDRALVHSSQRVRFKTAPPHSTEVIL